MFSKICTTGTSQMVYFMRQSDEFPACPICRMLVAKDSLMEHITECIKRRKSQRETMDYLMNSGAGDLA